MVFEEIIMRKIVTIGMALLTVSLMSCSRFVEEVDVKACTGQNKKALHFQLQHAKEEGIKHFTFAKKFCEKAYAVKPNDELVKLGLVNAYTCLGEYKKAQKIIDTYDKKSEDTFEKFQIKRAKHIAKEGKYDCFDPKNKFSIQPVSPED
jgi:hypothetical protein